MNTISDSPAYGARQDSSAQPTGKQLAVLTAAREVFLTHGFSAATTDMIQRAAGVSKATVYAYYPTKQALFEAVIEGKCAEHMATLRSLRSVPGAIHAVLSELANAYLEFGVAPEGLALFRVSAAEAPRFPELARAFFENGPEAYCGIVAEHVERGVRNQELHLGDVSPQEAARLFFSLVRGQAQLEGVLLPDRRPSEAQKRRWAELAVRTFFAAFGKH